MSPLPERPVALDLPLRGSQLIEASAGTGKTFTIALLYVRLVLGHGQPDSTHSRSGNGFIQPLVPPEILVVTFTEAASLELRDRIRGRLVQATEAFRTQGSDDGLAATDPLLHELRDEFAVEAWPQCARRLEVAAEWMDDAAISTIHSWAQRMLKEHAFDSGKLFRQEILKDLTELTLEVVTDYWRTRVYPLSESEAAAMVALFGSPQGLYEKLRKLLQRQDAALVFVGEPIDASGLEVSLKDYSALRDVLTQAESKARAAYQASPETVRDTLFEVRDAMNGNTFPKVKEDATFHGWLDELKAWGCGEQPLEEANFVQKLARERLKLRKGNQLPELELFDELQTWNDHRADGEGAKHQLLPRVLADAREWVRQRLAAQLESRAQMGFDGMISGLDSALEGEAGEVLAQRIRTQFPVAMIDEFQDTDPAQYRIFQRIYQIGSETPDAALILIGDPKQAIYGFRGGDIHTYLAAREATVGRHHTLGTNFRSSEAMVAAVNHLFAHAEHAHLREAFRFADPEKERENPLPFQRVEANGREEQLFLSGELAPALTGWLLTGDKDNGCAGVGTYRRNAARHCAHRIAEWLNEADAGRAGFRARGEAATVPLRARDIAVLVRDKKEAAAIRDALSECGLASIYLSDRDSVFATPEARDLLYWLKAIASPEDVSALRSALATASLGRSLAWLDALQRDETLWEEIQERFIRYRQLWQRRGVLPALRQLLHDFQVPAQLLGSGQGERPLTNLLHLAEWAQEVSDSLDGDHALIRLLAEHIADPGNDEQVLRLESDADLIQIVTIFKSKGLEYPVVALPFVCSYREVDVRYGSPLYHLEHRPVLELAPRKDLARDGFEQADDERISEDVRLIYVALTRARHATFVGLAALAPGQSKTATLHKSALGHLLAGGEKIPDLQSLRSLWQSLAEGCADIVLEEADTSLPGIRYELAAPSVGGKHALQPAHAAFTRWWIASYSALRYQAGGHAPETAGAEVRDEERESEVAPFERGETRRPAPGTLHSFPRGPEPGTFLHGVLEDLANAGFERVLRDNALLEQMEERCRKRGWESHAPALRQGIQAWLTTPLAPEGHGGPTLAQLQRYRAEPDFWFATVNAATAVIDRLVQVNLFPDAPRPLLGEQQLNGLMKGFIDLLVEHEGRFYVIDWKSNWLGPDSDAYQAEAMQQAALEKRYDLQLAIYLVALHRHLRHTLGEAYDYERHVGGAMLVFLRGIEAPSRGVINIKPPLAFIEALDDCLAGAGPVHVAQENQV